MKRLSLYLFLIFFTLQIPSWADDIRDFQIEGMSIGDSLLDYFTEEEIKKYKKNYYKDNKFSISEFNISSETYDGIQVHFKNNDKNYKIYGLSGIKDFRNSIQDCYKTKDEIESEISELFRNLKKTSKTKKHDGDPSGKSKSTNIYFDFDSGDHIKLSCIDWSKETGWWDNLRIELIIKELNDWLINEAYK